jgi:hypothetical protein
MYKFEQVGVNKQYAANSKAEAQKAFAYSCDCCCNKGMRLDCDTCAIANVHSLVMACFDSTKLTGKE